MSQIKEINNPYRLVSTRVINMHLNGDKLVVDELSNELNFDFSFTHRIATIEKSKNDYDKKLFVVEFDLKVYNSLKTFSLNTVFQVWFQCEREIAEGYIETPGVKINSPAIAFPFLRSFISTLTINAGYPPIVLPSINFVRLIMNEEQNKAKGDSL